MNYTANDKVDCIRRELKMRKQVYSRRVHDGKMSQALANREIAIMEAILTDYLHQAELECPRLFAG